MLTDPRPEVLGGRLYRSSLLLVSLSLFDRGPGPNWRPNDLGYYCVRDTLAPQGVRPLREVKPYRQDMCVWPLSFSPDTLLLVERHHEWPVVIDATKLLDSLRTASSE